MNEKVWIKAVGDEIAGMTYLTLVEVGPGGVARTEDLGRVRLDYDAADVLVGIELDGLLGPILTHSTLGLTFPEWFSQPTITGASAPVDPS